MVAQKSAERIKNGHLSIDSEGHDDDQSSLQSSCESSLGSLKCIDEDEDVEDEDEDEEVMDKNNDDNMSFRCKDSFTNAMVKEATMLNNLFKEQMMSNKNKQKPNDFSSSTTPAKKVSKTPTKFTVFQDGKENSVVCDENNGGTPFTAKKKRSALRPKSTNNCNIMPTASEKKKKSVNTSTFKKTQDTAVRKLVSSPPPQSVSEVTKEDVSSESNIRSQKDTTNNNKDSAVEKNEENLSVENNVETKTASNNIDHGALVEDAGELLSLCSTVSPSVKSVEGSLECQSPSQGTSTNGNNKKEFEELNHSNHTISFSQTPGASVQTFSIEGRSYSIDVSSNVIKSIFSPIERHFSPKAGSETSIQKSLSKSDESESLSCETIYHDTLSPRNYLNDTVSPVSRALATGINDSMMTVNGGISKASAASLIERNKTLYKEVRFADQTCVELSERNAGMQREVKRLESQVNEMKGSNEALQEALMKSKQSSARVEANNEMLIRQMKEQKSEHDSKMKELEKALIEANNRQSSTEKQLVSVQSKYESLLESHHEEKAKVSGLMERLATSQSAAEMSATSAAESYRSFCHETQSKIERLEKLAEDRLEMFNNERNQRFELERRMGDLMQKCNDQHVHQTPSKASSEVKSPQVKVLSKTPTSTVLARTLEAELQHKYDATERILEAEMIISVTQSELQETSRQLETARTEINRLSDQVNRLSIENDSLKRKKAQEATIDSLAFDCASIDVSSFDSCSTEELVGQALSQRLTYAKSECEAYKRDLESLLKEIKRQLGESFHSGNGSNMGSNDQRVQGLLLAVRELSIISSLQVNEINEFKIRDRENRQHIESLKKVVNEKENQVSDLQCQIEVLQREM